MKLYFLCGLSCKITGFLTSYFQGVKRSEQNAMLELFRARISSEALAQQEESVVRPSVSEDSSRIRRLEKLIKKQIL